MKTIKMFMIRVYVTALISAIAVSSCDLEISAPHLVEEDDLWQATALPVIVAGVMGDFAWATGGFNFIFGISALLTDEWVHSGSYVAMRIISDGISYDNTNVIIQDWWAEIARARWTAEEAVRRITIMMENEKDVAEVGMPAIRSALARVSLYAGFANRVLGDSFDFAVIDGGPAQPLETYFERALTHLDRAIEFSEPGAPIHTAAIGAKAQIYIMWDGEILHQGDWERAVQFAGQVPTSFIYNQIHSNNSERERNNFHWWGYLRNENTVWGTHFAEWGMNIGVTDSIGDPRVKYDDSGVRGGDSIRPFYRQLKYSTYSDDIPVVKGTEMRLIEAEALLREGDTGGMVRKINEVRQYYGITEIDPVDVNVENAWYILMKERGIELWLEGRRLPDLRRWDSSPGREEVPFTVIRMFDDAPVSVYDVIPGLYLRVSRDEKDSNPNL